jgi:hypothetical protein
MLLRLARTHHAHALLLHFSFTPISRNAVSHFLLPSHRGRRIAARPAVKKGILVNKMDQTGVTERHSNADFDNHKSKM